MTETYDLVPAPPSAAASNASGLTWVDLVHEAGRREHWVRFGHPVCDVILDRHHRRQGFRPEALLAFVRWSGAPRRTAVSRLDILQTVAPGEACSTVPGVAPGGELILRLHGWSRVGPALRIIDAVEALGLDPAQVALDYWRHVHARLQVGLTPRVYDLARHRAWRLRVRVAP